MNSRKPIAQMTHYEILEALAEDGFNLDRDNDAEEFAETIQLAARAGALLWSSTQIVSTLSSRPLHLMRTLDELLNR